MVPVGPRQPRSYSRHHPNASTLPPTRIRLGGVPGSPAPRPGRGEVASPSVPPPICSRARSTGSSREPRRALHRSAPPSLLAAEVEAGAGRSGRSLAPHILPSWKAPERKRRYRIASSLPAPLLSQLNSPPLRALVLPDGKSLIIQAWQHRAKSPSVAQNHHAARVRPRPSCNTTSDSRTSTDYRKWTACSGSRGSSPFQADPAGWPLFPVFHAY